MSKNVRKLIKFTETMIDNIVDVQKKHGFLSFNAAVHFCVAETYKKEFKDYILAKTNTPTEEDKEEREKTKRQQIHDKQMAICNALGGEAKADGGTMYCVYYTYNRKNRYEQSVPLADINDTLLKNQFYPSKEAVQTLQNENRVNY